MDDPGDLHGVSPTQLREIEKERVAEREKLRERVAALTATIERLERMYSDKGRRARGQ